MKKTLFGIALVFGALFGVEFAVQHAVTPALAASSTFGDKQFALTVHDERSGAVGSQGQLTSGVYVFVYDAGTKTLSTIYSDRKRTAKTNPISRTQFATDTQVLFYGPNSTYDIFLAHSDGSVASYYAVTPLTHRLPLARSGSDKVLVFPMVFNSGGTETDTGLTLPLKSHVYDVAVEVVTVDATETVDIGLLSSGTGGDADGFIAGLSVATAGFIKPYVYTTGSNETYVSTAKFGVLMGPVLVGSDVDKDNGAPRGWGYVVDGSNTTSVTYTPSTSDTFAGYGYIYFKRLR